jgi:holo-[acyl-carrier protein] synthase
MSTSAVGVDIVEIERVEATLGRFGERFLNRVYTVLEVAVCRGRAHELAARFAAKESVMKALGTGARGIGWREIEVLPNHRGKPLVYLHGRAKKRAERIGLNGIDISLSHSREYAVAFVVGQSEDLEPDREAWRGKLIGVLRERGLLAEDQGPAAGKGL